MTDAERVSNVRVIHDSIYGPMGLSPVVVAVVIKLLRAQRARMRRKVNKKKAIYNEPVSDWGRGYVQACDDILKAMEER